MSRDRATGLMAIVLGIVVAVMTSQLPRSMMAGDIGPKVFPYITAGIMIICGIGLLLGKEADTGRQLQLSKTQWQRLGMIFAVVFVYIVSMDFVGFIVPTVLALFILSTMFAKGRVEVALWKRILFAVAVTLILYYLFNELLVMPLPRGKLF